MSDSKKKKKTTKVHTEKKMNVIPMLREDDGEDDELWAEMSASDEDLADALPLELPSRSASCLPLPSRTPVRAFEYPERGRMTPRRAHADGDDGASSSPPKDEAPTVAPKVDRIGTYFGYNGIDAHVPRPAYDALLQRVTSLESSLGAANLERNTQQNELEQLRSKMAHLLRESERQKEHEQRLRTWEESLHAKDMEITAREDALESVIRQQVNMMKRKPVERRVERERESDRHFLPRLPSLREGNATRSQSSLNF